MFELPEFIPMNEYEDRRVYKLKCRNLLVGAWCADQGGFIGIRMKFNDRYLDTEYARQDGGMYGTADATEALNLWVPEEIPMEELLCLECRYCGQIVEQIYEYDPEFKPNKGMKRIGDRHIELEAAEACEYDGVYCAQWRGNQALFDLLDPIDQQLFEERKKEREGH